MDFIGRWFEAAGGRYASWGTISFAVTFRNCGALHDRIIVFLLFSLFSFVLNFRIYQSNFGQRGNARQKGFLDQSLLNARREFEEFLSWGRLAARVKPYNVEMYHTCQVDDNDPFILSHQSGLMEIVTGLQKNTIHSIKCGRNTEAYYGPTILEALLVDDGCVALTPSSLANELHVEFLGDSITAGWQVLLSPGSWEQGGPNNEDVFRSYAGRLAQAWTSNWRVVAQTSIGVLPHQSFGVNFKAMKDQFLCQELKLYEACPKEWNFQLWQADVVVINLGTNDFIFNDPSESEFQAAYSNLIGIVRSKYPTALIFCISAHLCWSFGWCCEPLSKLAQHQSYAIYTGHKVHSIGFTYCLVIRGIIPLVQSCKQEVKWQKMVNGIRNAVASAGENVILQGSGDVQSKLLDCSSDYVDQIHPTEQGALRFAESLLPSMTPKIREFFPDKCQGTGTRCQAQSVAVTTTDSTDTTGQTMSTTSQTTSSESFSTSHISSGAICCYPNCNDPARVCNDETQSSYCTSSPTNCQSCGGELCGGPPATTGSAVTTVVSPTTERRTIFKHLKTLGLSHLNHWIV